MTVALTSIGIQQASVTIISGATSGTASITQVGTGAFPVWQGEITNDSADVVSALGYVQLLNNTTVQAVRSTSSTNTITINVAVVDGDTTNLIKTVQSGITTIATGNVSATSSISTVTNAHAAIFYLGEDTTGTTLTRACSSVTLSGTTVTASRNIGNLATTVSWVVVEFQGAALNSSIQNVTLSSAVSGTTFSSSITSVNTNNTMLAHGGSQGPGTTGAKEFPYIKLNNSTTVQSVYNTAPAALSNIARCSVIEFVSGILAQSVQRNTITLSSAINNTASITSSPTTHTLANWLGNNTTDAAINLSIDKFSLTQTSASVLTMSAGTLASGVGSYEVINFNSTGGQTLDPIWFGADA